MMAGALAAIPDHQLLRQIGRGGYGDVWIARSITGALRAVKVIYKIGFDDLRPFEREFQGIQAYEPLSRMHPNLLTILHVGRSPDEQFFYYIMELADSACPPGAGGWESYEPMTLKQQLREKARFNASAVVEIGLTLADALGFLHQRDLVHRDIKLSNVVFVNGKPKLADLGLVSSIQNATSLVGTEGYFPPDGCGTKSADVYALGKVIYEMWTGLDRTEFPELPQILRLKNSSDWRTQELNAIVLKACDPRASGRYLHALELHEELLGLTGSEQEKRPKSRNYWRSVTTVFIFLGLLYCLNRLPFYAAHQSVKNPEILAGPIISPLNGHAYYLLNNSTWFVAESRAKTLGGHLVTIRNQAENDWIYKTFSGFGGVERHLWLGLYDSDLEHNASNNVSRRAEFFWISGEPVTYSNWGIREPSGERYGKSLEQFEAYGLMFSPSFNDGVPGTGGQWNDAIPKILGFKGPLGERYSPINGVVEIAPPGALMNRVPILAGPIENRFNQHRYYLLENSSWLEAEARAKALGGHLATIRNAQEQDWVYGTFSRFKGVNRHLWIGLYDTDLEHNATNHISRRAEFAWVSGDPVTYSNWGSLEPSGEHYNSQDPSRFEAYVHMFSPAFNTNFPGLGGQWNDAASTILGSAGPGVPYSPVNGVVEVLPSYH
jgi:serine/threonine protein kinase